jgi:diguanylate cyclase (GGDEF)-like protein/PAS domain S-box-containing protein
VTALRGEVAEPAVLGLPDAGGDIAWVRASARAWQDDGGSQAGVVVTLEPMQDHAPSPHLLPGGAHQSPVGICVTDGEARIEYANPAYCDLCGYALSELVGQPLTMLVPAAGRDELGEGYRRLCAEGGQLRGEQRVLHRAGEVHTVLAEAVRTPGRDGRARVVTYVMDITVLKAHQEQLSRDSSTDPLTGLYNRRHADEVLEREVRRADRYGVRLALALMDIDHFKWVNDQFGHPCGDQVLVTLAAMLGRAVRRADVVARYGGEEFMILFPQTSLESAAWTCERIRINFGGILVPCAAAPITLSIGVTAYQAGESKEQLLARADDLLYRAKAAGRNRTMRDPGAETEAAPD